MKYASTLIAIAFSAVFAGGSVAAADSVAPASATANRFAATNVPAERFEAGVLAVERHGSRGTPLILVPGLGGGAWVWQNAISRFKQDHVVYVVTLPGFDGRPAASGPVFDQTRDALRQLIISRKLDRPVVIGHSMGGTLAIALAETDVKLRGVVSIDGLAVTPGSEQTPAAMRGQMAAAIKAKLASADPAAFAGQQQQYMRGIGVTDLPTADELAKLQARSNPGAVADIMAEVIGQDLRPALPKIGVPVLVLAPFFEADAVQRGLTEEMVKNYYSELMAGTPHLTVQTIAPSRHFAMFDQPEAVDKAIADFIKPL